MQLSRPGPAASRPLELVSRQDPVPAAGELDEALRAIPGVIETGLFVKRADVVVVAGGAGVRRLSRPS